MRVRRHIRPGFRVFYWNIHYLEVTRIPHPNYRNISLRKEVYWKLQRLAEEQGMSISQLLSLLLENVNPASLQPTQASSINQEPCGEPSEKIQTTIQNENDIGNSENWTDCPFSDTCPFTDPEYIKRHGFIYKPRG